ncbi:MAG: hypothetical protein O2960_29185 [Verrucomicrobia bacterium]|nr:hypothetical protein [Verrucomicrobiota bacterium]
MKTVSVTVEEAAWEAMQKLAKAEGKALGEIVSNAVSELSASRVRTLPSPEERRRVLGKFWDRIDACNVEIGERPTRARTYDHRRFHRY